MLDGSALWRVDATGAAERLLTADPGERFMYSTWSPDRSRIAFVVASPKGMRIQILDAATRAVSVATHHGCPWPEWLTDHSLACFVWSVRSVVILELLLSSSGGEARERVRYSGPEYQRPVGMSASPAGVLFSTAPSDQHLALVDLEPPGKVRRIALDSITDLPPVGWTSSGSLIFGAKVQGHLRIMAMAPDGNIEAVRAAPDAEVPLVVVGDTIIFGRFPGGERVFPFRGAPGGPRAIDGELIRLTLPGGALESLGRTHDFVTLVCAAGRAAPCILGERSGDEVVAVEWDSATGARGRERARWSLTRWHDALSPDGRTLAQVTFPRGRAVASFVDLESGLRRPVAIPFDFPHWRPDGTLLGIGADATGSGIVRVRNLEKLELVAALAEPMTSFEAFQVSPDGKTAAIITQDESYTYWWADRPPD